MTIYTHHLYWIHLPEHTDYANEGYIGVSNNPERRVSEHYNNKTNPYFGRIINKYKQCLQITILFQGIEEACYSLEEELRPEKNIGWNINKGGSNPPLMTGIPRKEETKKKIAEKLNGRLVSNETRDKISKKGKQRICSEETKQKLRERFLGKKRPVEVGIKISNSKKGKPGVSPSQEIRDRVSEKLKNRKFSEETRAKISAAKKQYWELKRQSP